MEESNEDDNHLCTLHATWQALVHVTTRVVQVHNAVEKNSKIKEDEVLLDNQADISIIYPRLLQQVKDF